MSQLQIYTHNQWINIELEDLHRGDIFRMLNENDTPIKDEKGFLTWKCTCDAFYDKECERYCINTKGIDIQNI